MSQLPITSEQLAALPPEFQTLLQAVIDHFEQRIAALEDEIAAIKKTPRNSSLPPSAEHPHAKPSANQPKSPKNPDIKDSADGYVDAVKEIATAVKRRDAKGVRVGFDSLKQSCGDCHFKGGVGGELDD